MKYQIKFFSNWHCGSGQAAGADVDELAIKDSNRLPFVPGRTIKGLLRDACEDLKLYDGLKDEDIRKVFGYFKDKPDEAQKGEAYFSNATLPEGDQKAIVDAKQQDYLYQSVSATAIDDEGIAQDHSLRKVQTVVPCTLEGEIDGVPDDFKPYMVKAMKLVKRLGLGRNHGLGRCEIKPKED